MVRRINRPTLVRFFRRTRRRDWWMATRSAWWSPGPTSPRSRTPGLWSFRSPRSPTWPTGKRRGYYETLMPLTSLSPAITSVTSVLDVWFVPLVYRTTHLEDASGILHFIVSVPRLARLATLDRHFPSDSPRTLPRPPTQVVAVEGGGAAVACPSLGRPLLPEEVSAAVLRGMWAAHLGGPPARADIAGFGRLC